MLVETARVVAAWKDRAIVKTYRGEACHACQAHGACKALGGGKEMKVEVLNHLRAKAGDRVELALPETSFIKASAITWLIPLCGFMGGAILGQFMSGSLKMQADHASALLALAGLILAVPIVFTLNRRLAGKENYIPKIIRILPPSEEGQGRIASGELEACQS